MTEFSQQRFEAAFRGVQSCGVFAVPFMECPTLHLFESLASTNQTLWELLEQGAGSNTVVIAQQQVAGRGQWGRQWQSPPGGLYLSWAIATNLAAEVGGQLTLASAWGIAQALRQIPPRLSGVTTEIPVQIKWLNDLVLFGRKLGGILTETRVQQGRITRAVVGVGINWTNPVPDLGINFQSFLENQPVPLMESIELLAAIVVYGLMASHELLHQHGIEPLLVSYQNLLINLGDAVVVEGGTGTIVGVSATGELRVRMDSDTSSEIYLKPGTINLGYHPMPPEQN
jgi:BirA family transcriptional regulator, biotin operon repressor / biotin---[acetyl-CoA-carboxylase] ligase